MGSALLSCSPPYHQLWNVWRGRACGNLMSEKEPAKLSFPPLSYWTQRDFSLLSPLSLASLSLASLSQPANFSFFAGSRCASLPSTILPRRTLPRCCSPLSRCPATVLPLSRLISPPSRPAAAALISLSLRLISPPRRTAALLSSPLAELRASLSLLA